MSLIYLLASLPTLHMQTASGMKPETFFQACREQLSTANALTVYELFRGKAATHPFAKAWADKEIILRNAVAQERARLLGQDSTRWLRNARGSDGQVEARVKSAFEKPDPLTREKELDRIRWLMVEELQGFDPISIKVVFAYAVKLSLQARWLALNTTHGRATVDTLTQLL